MKTETQALQDAIVEEFLGANGTPLSGTSLSEKLGVTRTAIWKHIRQLEDLGFRFQSTPKIGHRLTVVPDVLMEPLLKRTVPGNLNLGHPVLFTAEVDSTNRFAGQLAASKAAHGTLVAAQLQTTGRGRRGRVWFSHSGGAWFSLILKKPLPLRRAFELTLLASVALRRAIVALTELEVKVKWPNDLFVGDKKVSGILAEIKSDGEQVQQAILGVGVNCNIPREDFPESLKDVATSLLAESGQRVDRTVLVGRFLKEYAPMVDALSEGRPAFELVHAEWCDFSHTLGRTVRVETSGQLISGLARRLTKDGTLIVATEGGREIAVHSGEVLF